MSADSDDDLCGGGGVHGEEARAFLRAMRRRYACKKFRADAPLSDDEIGYILECGRLSPSSFGLEHWHFAVATTRETIALLGSACFDQEAVSSAQLVIVTLVRKAEAYEEDSAFVKQRSGRFPGGHPVFRSDYIGYREFLEREHRVDAWARSQAYIACANMMTGAAAAGLDSCAIEGFDEKSVLDILSFDPKLWNVALALSFGRRDEDVRPKIRETIETLVSRF